MAKSEMTKSELEKSKIANSEFWEPGSGSIWAEGSEPRFHSSSTPARMKLPYGWFC